MADTIITKEMIRKLITQEHLQPQDLFGQEDLALWRESMDYADKVAADLNREDAKKAAAARADAPPGPAVIPAGKDKTKEDPNAKYLSPGTNPFIKPF